MQLAPWLNAIGYSLCFGTIVVKMFRVYYIFNSPTPAKKVVSYITLLSCMSDSEDIVTKSARCFHVYASASIRKLLALTNNIPVAILGNYYRYYR